VAVQPDGKIVTSGVSENGLAIYRLKDDGSFDASFDGGVARIGTGYFDAGSLVLQPDGKIVTIAQLQQTSSDPALVVRFNANGKLDPAFHGTGSTTVDPGTDVYPHSLAIQPDGKILAGGGVDAGSDALLFRLNGDGSRDAAFGEDGIFTFSRGGLDNDAVMALAPDGKIVLAGDNSNTTSDSLVWRFRGDFKDPGNGGGQPGGGGEPGGGQGGGGPVATRCAGSRATIVGSAKSDRLRGTAGRDVIAGLGGNDTVTGLDDNNVVCGGAGRDVLRGGAGRDRLVGGPGRDRLVGGPGRDRLIGGPGRDRIRQ
jgi:uncharacterized delta-60 repeat protein